MKKNYTNGRHPPLLGFSLLELMVVLILVVGLMMIAIPAIRSITGLELKTEITKMAGLAREVYAQASISGKSHRIVFDLDKGTYWVEEKDAEISTIQPELGYEDLMKTRIQETEAGFEKSEEDPFIPRFKKKAGSLGEKVQLPSDMVILGAWTEQMSDVGRSGQVSIYFFPGGYTQTSFVSLALKDQEDKSQMYFSLQPLTGSVEIQFGEPDIEELLSEQSGE